MQRVTQQFCVHMLYLYCDPPISGEEVELAALKQTENQAIIFLSLGRHVV